MSEYAEKHTVSKLIGSPAGYVGYDDGGLLTDAIRKTPHCVLLLDEIEKAHPDIYNVLLQVMDYASLTDNRGQKADFRNVIIIMTSNAGARMIGKQNIGFGASRFNDSVMMEEVKRVFTPEFRNRLSAVVTFNHMNSRMAGQITDKKIAELSERLKTRKVQIQVGDDAKDYIVKRAITKDYGGREIERIIDSEVKPLFVSEILFGSLKNGGDAKLIMKDGKPALEGKRSAHGSSVKKTIEPEDLINGKKTGPKKPDTKNSGSKKSDPKKPGPAKGGKAQAGNKLSQKVKRSSGKKEEE
jgi:ATP-dependent Clp protease ATP-binding subunit ClpA